MMMCKRPYMKRPSGISRVQTLDKEARLQATPFACGRCLHCRINKARVWTHRIMLEAGQHEFNTFLTLTYSDENLPKGGNVEKRDLQLFWKRLRKNVSPRKIRYFACGEYGDQSWRPHYHAAVFGLSPLENKTIETAWSYGHSMLGDLNKDSARYITGYIMKNMYWKNDLLEGRKPEFMSCSRKPGIGTGGAIEASKKIREGYNNYNIKRRRIKEFRYGRSKALPLGRHLQGIMDDALEIDESVIENDLWRYQEEQFEKLEKDKPFIDSITDASKQKRLVQEKRQKIFRQRKSL